MVVVVGRGEWGGGGGGAWGRCDGVVVAVVVVANGGRCWEEGERSDELWQAARKEGGHGQSTATETEGSRARTMRVRRKMRRPMLMRRCGVHGR